jgi:hypothetical protein
LTTPADETRAAVRDRSDECVCGEINARHCPVHADADQNRDAEYPHATDPPRWWCRGRYEPVPIRYVGLGHPAAPRLGWPVYRCTDCGDELFHAERGNEEEQKIRKLAAVVGENQP